MRYNFDEEIDRHGTNSRKWEGMQEMFGRNDLFPMWIADMDFKTPPEIIEAIKKRADHGIFGYTFRPESFYDSIIKWMKTRHNVDVKKEWIVDGAGVVSTLTIAVLSYTNPGDEIIVQPPVYYPFFRIIQNNGRVIVNNPLRFENGRYTMNFEDLLRKITKRTRMLILCSPHNPVGRVWKSEEIETLGKICQRHDIIVASDEIHSDFVYSPNVHTSVLSTSFKESTLAFIAPNKTFNLAGIPSSVVIIPDKRMRDRFLITSENFELETSNIFSIVATEAAYTYGAEWLDELLTYLKGNFDLVRSFLKENIPQAKLVNPEGTYLGWIDFRGLGLSDGELYNLITEKAGIALDDGNLFGIGGSGFQRMNVAMPRNMLLKGLKKLEESLRR
ncbi:MalY/PatB family protein [Athalassotoga saccharophila]|uniref:MalY/PatB family protein n=1 Tax=Athalassotoga saccharophila TaxID=1441386 RepID=UPI001379A42A|nr:MalY/PatB family protein [Athalassotoga saccharophila]BBJ28604.1 cystathionine beta-lyase PatB [Athalassotoga saccharophila]